MKCPLFNSGRRTSLWLVPDKSETCPTPSVRVGRIQRNARHHQIRNHHRESVDDQSIDHPQHCRPGLHFTKSIGLLEEVGAREERGRYPTNPFQLHWISTPAAACEWLVTLEMVSESVRTLSHSCSRNPCDSKKARIWMEFQPRISSRIGISTLSPSSLRMVRRAICVMYLFSDNAMVSPSSRFTCSITCTSELPSPT